MRGSWRTVFIALAIWTLGLCVIWSTCLTVYAKKRAPSGAILGVGFGDQTVTIQLATGTRRFHYTKFYSARVSHGFMVLFRASVLTLVPLALPAQLFSPDLPRDLKATRLR